MRPVLYYQELLRRQQVNYIDPHWPEKVLGTSKLCQLLLQSNETSVLTADSSSIAISSVPYLSVLGPVAHSLPLSFSHASLV